MQRKVGTEIDLGKAVYPFDRIGASSAINGTAWKYLNAGKKLRKIRKLIQTGTYNAYQWEQPNNRI